MKMNLRNKILSIVVLPLCLLGIVTIIITITQTRSSLIEEVKDSLRGTAAATLAAYDQNSGEYLKAENGDVWKGGYNISKSDKLLDNIKEQSGMDVTFFYGSQRIMSSAKDANGQRILGSPAGDVIVQKVLQNGEEFFSSRVSLDGVQNYGYYIPVYQKGAEGSPVGMIFVGTNKKEKDQAIDRILKTVIFSVLAVVAICIFVAVSIAVSESSNTQVSLHLAPKNSAACKKKSGSSLPLPIVPQENTFKKYFSIPQCFIAI